MGGLNSANNVRYCEIPVLGKGLAWPPQRGLWTILLPTEAEVVAMGQGPSILDAENQGHIHGTPVDLQTHRNPQVIYVDAL